MNASDVLDRLLDPVANCLSPEAARRLANLRADDAAQARIDELAEKGNEGTLTELEREEYRTYISAANLIAILQAKARLVASGTAA